MKDSLESPHWTPAIMGVRTGEREIRLVCGNDGSEDLPHTYKTIAVSLHGYSHESDLYSNSVSFFGRASKLRLLFQPRSAYLNIYFKSWCGT